jgi:signal transduction histidine kinase/CheY-like chemotaxis protein
VTLLAAYAPLLDSLGWLAALMFAAVWLSVPGAVGRRQGGWLIGFCAVRLVAAAQSVVFGLDPEWRQLAAAVSGLALWEFARRTWNETRRRRISPATHLVAVECLALVAAVALHGGVARPEWFLPVDVLYSILPGLLGGGGAWLLWRTLAAETPFTRRAALRLAVVGLGLYGLPAEGWSALPPWIVAVGLGLACLALPAVRSPAALGCVASLGAIAVIGPLAVAAGERHPEAAQRADLLARVERAAVPLQRRLATRLDAERIDPATRELLRGYVEKLRATDPLVHTAALWRLRAGRVGVADLATGDFVDAPAPAAVPADAARLGAFVIPADITGGHPFATACAPLRPGAFESPTAWLALEFPDVFWAARREQAHRTGVALVEILAAFCALGFVLIVRQRLENAQQLDLERMRAADRAKSEFLAFLGHELRTPLQTVLGRAELLRAQPEAARHAVAIEAQGQLLLRLVNDLLDLGTIEAGHFRLRPAVFSLRRTLAAVEDTARPLADAKHLALAVTVDPAVPDALVGDEARLRQILGNLVGNAVKYTAQGSVALHVAGDDSERRPAALGVPPGEPLVFTVRDTGPGLPLEKIPQLFTLFTRLDAGDTFTREGTGVGLALVQRLCTLMGGTVAAGNQPGGGAELTVRLAFPLAESAPAGVSSPATAASFATGGRAVLLAEDDTATRELLAEALSALGHTVEAAADGPAALAAAATRRFDVAVLDVNLPGIDGVTLARRLRERHAPLRIVGCSAEALPAVRDAALAAGFDAFLVKPVSLAALAQAVGRAESALAGATLFDRLNSPETAARTRAILGREWPRLRADTEAALAAGDRDALRRLSHYLQSSALLLADADLLALCRQLSAAKGEATPETARARLDAIGDHLARWNFDGVNPAAASHSVE